MPIAQVDLDKAIAKTSVPGTYPLSKPRFGHFPQGTAWLENGVEFIDEPGEWAINKKVRLIYIWHEGDAPPPGIVVPKLTELVRVEGAIDYNGVEK